MAESKNIDPVTNTAPGSTIPRMTRVINLQYRKARASANPYIQYAIDPANIAIWYVKLYNFSGDQDEYAAGEYLCKIVIGPDFPYKPPEFYFMTPNGVYECDGKACISIGEFHSNAYINTLGVSGFVEQLVSGMIGWKTIGTGVRLMDTTIEEKKKWARGSAAYNTANYGSILKLISEAN